MYMCILLTLTKPRMTPTMKNANKANEMYRQYFIGMDMAADVGNETIYD